ncbi:uncharacterized protein [Cicer arietinum]|uniref:Zinc finger protein ZAT1-like n=1 Tax=Cicer arietinum TaxID=3827 RepID=A0A1S2Z7D6_CICAR|nr:zinc finger protein ZAT1-like [Cicer arietinum]
MVEIRELSPTMENNSRVCTICNKSFSNGKALGGHMKSHLAKLPVPPKPPNNSQVIEYSLESTKRPTHSFSSSSSSSSHSRNNPMHNLRSLKRNFYYTLANFGRNSFFESCPKNPTRKRSKRHRKQFKLATEKRESTQYRLMYDEFDIEAAKTLVIISMKEWQQIEEKYNKEMAKVNGNEST